MEVRESVVSSNSSEFEDAILGQNKHAMDLIANN